ncbi:NAD(P)H-dependent oxidoreductase [Streptomyces sp. DSM 44917]|uniref:NAD(P)H-dependent oxidoreductase n=1 Tax=Streptomyces boetiae TaxID=3075541 RepID=A0ABU2L8L0_9ACTN|nr:NAD(P)H-dependent oxidoreductase [Streptomyces sp. DSM 44917]MDT0307896.1 NAD(P)H-dependent oxidoreductase [Streptomyces sp. DSM 44917]
MTTEDTTGKNVLIVSAHPERRSLNAALAALAAGELGAAGHRVRTSDLYAMKWKAGVDADDFPAHDPADRLDVMAASERATAGGALTADVTAEQEKLLWADAVILQFPLWWFGVPALLKGWIDRVFTAGFGYGTTGRWPHYGDGRLAGRRALVSVTIGAGAPSFSARGIHGSLHDVLFPLQHGLFFYTGMEVLEPFAVYDAAGLGEADFPRVAGDYRARLRGLFGEEPLPYRRLGDGDYTRQLELREDFALPENAGPGVHLRR